MYKNYKNERHNLWPLRGSLVNLETIYVNR
jgi:hypothetical protein